MNEHIEVANVDTGDFWTAVAILVVFCWGEPDLMDALIYWLMQT